MNLSPFLIEAYAGRTKSSDVDDYLKEFSAEIISLKANGVLCGISKSLRDFDIRCFICDAPAASFVAENLIRRKTAAQNVIKFVQEMVIVYCIKTIQELYAPISASSTGWIRITIDRSLYNIIQNWKMLVLEWFLNL